MRLKGVLCFSHGLGKSKPQYQFEIVNGFTLGMLSVSPNSHLEYINIFTTKMLQNTYKHLLNKFETEGI